MKFVMIKKLLFSKKINFFFVIFLFGLSFFSIPTFSFLPKLNSLTWVFTGLLILGMVFNILFINKKFTFDCIIVSYIIFILVAFIGYLLTAFSKFTFTIFLNTGFIVLSYSYTKVNETTSKYIYFAIFTGILAFSFVFFFMYKSEILSLDFDRLGDKFGDINDIGIILSIGFIIGMVYFFQSKKWQIKVLCLLACFFLFIMSFCTGSKIVLFINISGSLFMVYKYFGKTKWYISLSITVAIIAIGISILLLPPFQTMKDRFLNMIFTIFGFKYKNMPFDLSLTTRFDMIKNGFSLFLRRPLFGNGPSGFAKFSSYKNMWSHNHISESLCNYGILGTIAYHAPFYFFFKKKSGKNVKMESALIFVFAICCLSVALFEEKFFTYLIGIVLAKVKTKELITIGGINDENC